MAAFCKRQLLKNVSIRNPLLPPMQGRQGKKIFVSSIILGKTDFGRMSKEEAQLSKNFQLNGRAKKF